jgi:hypothetical protein
MFVMNMQAYPHTPGAHAEVKAEWTHYAGVGVKKMHSGLIMDTASPERLKNLQPLCDLIHIRRTARRAGREADNAAAGA